MKKIVSLILLSCLFIACKKTEVGGTVYNKNMMPVSGATIQLEEFDGSSSKYPKKTRDVAKSDINGNYHFSFTAKKRYAYWVNASTNSSDIRGYPLKYLKSINLDIYLTK